MERLKDKGDAKMEINRETKKSPKLFLVLSKFWFNLKFLIALHNRNFLAYFKITADPLRESIYENSVHWLGHATVIINLYGKIIVTDPVVGSLGYFKRLVKPSLDLGEIRIDYILLSHGHMDHMDFASLYKLNKDSYIIAPKGYKRILKALGFNNIIILNDHEEYKDEHVHIKALPANHDGRRYYLGKNYHSNSYIIESKDKKIFFAGDTAYTEEFKDIACNLCLMPVGCYKPQSFEKMHCTPEQSFKMFKMMKSYRMIPIHYKTFILSHENPEETLSILKKINDGSIEIIDIGQTIDL